MTEASTNQKAKVFISYSRDDIGFADQLVAALESFGFELLIDRQGIPGGEDWKAQLRHMIVEADSIVFVLSPRSAVSKLCEWEVEEADQLNKRLLPIVCAPLASVSVPSRLADLNYIYFYPEPRVSGSGFGSGLGRLVAALNTDLDWIKDHTRLGALSERWQTRKKDVALLLRGDELEEAERWLARKSHSAPEPTELLRAFLTESRNAEAARMDRERQQLAEIAAAQAAREAALKKAEDAQANIANEQARRPRSQRLTRRVITAAGTTVLIGGAIVAYLQWDKAQQLAAKEVALAESRQQLDATRANLGKRQLELDHSRAYVLAELSAVQLSRGDIDSALRLALRGARIDLTLPSEAVEVSKAGDALAAALSQIKWRFALAGHDGPVESAAFSPDGSRVVTSSDDKTARIWGAASAKEIAVLRGHDATVWSAAFSPDGSRVVTSSDDKTARIWDSATAKQIAVLRGHNEGVFSATFSPDGSRIVTASRDNTARIWDAATAKQIAILRHDEMVRSANFSRDGSRIVTASAATARIWDAATATQIAVLSQDDGVTSAAFSPDGSRIVTTLRDKTARVWRVATAKQIAVLGGHDAT
jgi:hypothetical protein